MRTIFKNFQGRYCFKKFISNTYTRTNKVWMGFGDEKKPFSVIFGAVI